MIRKYNDSVVANEMAEPILPSLFELTIHPHPSLQLADVTLLKQEIKSLSGLDAFEKIPDLISQTFGPGTRRLFPGVQCDNVIEANCTCNVNLRGDDGTAATALTTLKRMKDLQFNRATGRRGLKKECIFTVIVTRFNKDESIWYVATLENCMFGSGGITGLDEVNIESDDAATLSFTISSDKNHAEYAAPL